jgi:hypothetical protein
VVKMPVRRFGSFSDVSAWIARRKLCTRMDVSSTSLRRSLNLFGGQG